MSENLKNNGVQQYLQQYEKLVNKGIGRNFSKETADTMFDLKDAEISALRTELDSVNTKLNKALVELEWWSNYGQHVSNNRPNADYNACNYADKIQEDNA